MEGGIQRVKNYVGATETMQEVRIDIHCFGKYVKMLERGWTKVKYTVPTETTIRNSRKRMVMYKTLNFSAKKKQIEIAPEEEFEKFWKIDERKFYFIQEERSVEQ